LDDGGGIRRDNEIVSLVTQLYDEVQALRSALQEHGMRLEVYDKHIRVIESVLTVQGLTTHWIGVKSKITSEVTSVLAVLAETLDPDDDDVLDPTTLAQFHEHIQELRDQVDASELPDRLKAFLRRQLNLIIRAIIEYPISGSRAFQRASHLAGGDWIAQSAMLAESADHPLVKATQSSWQTIASWGRTAYHIALLGHFLLIELPATAERVQQLGLPFSAPGAQVYVALPPEEPRIEGVDATDGDPPIES
jgi:hypothetical protein